MPASDDSFYNIKRLHVVFAAASLALVAATVWMVARDHFRPWKMYQRTYRDRIEPWLTEARLRQDESKEYLAVDHELEKALAEARGAVPDAALVERFCRELKEQAASLEIDAVAEVGRIRAAYEALAAEPGEKSRDALVAAFDQVVSQAELPQERLQRQLQLRRAEFDEARTAYESAVGRGLPQAGLDKLQAKVDGLKREIDSLRGRLEEATARHESLAAIRREVTRAEDRARQALARHRASVSRLDRALAAQRPNLGKRLLRLPFIDAFGRPLAIDQIWLPELTIDYNFCQVPRFDRCRTCHQGIEENGLGIGDWELEKVTNPSLQSPIPNFQSLLAVKLATPSDPPKPEEPSLEAAYGFVLALEGMLDADAATVGLVLPKTPAAMARLQVGDVIEKVAGHEITSRADAVRSLVSEAQWGKPLELGVRRGLPEPYCRHPRLDLFVGSLSPHPASRFGCTICHDGQGSATGFQYASHAPNTLADRARWSKEHGWSPNPFWDYPMLPARFLQSRCLKCHHEVTDLEPSERFPDPPAEKLLAGYNLIRQNGCFGCHEIRGVSVKTSGESVGPDMRLEPNYSEAAQQLLADPALSDDEKALARQIVDRPELAEPRHELAAAIKSELLGKDSRAALSVLAADVASPGTMRKVGPTLRHVADKLDAVFLDAWSRNPKSFRPGTRMPEFYGIHEHLDGQALTDARRFEAVEIRAITEYLLAASQPLAPLPPPHGAEPPSPERGKRLFQTRGCLGCHKHADFPAAQSTFGPDLTNLGAKLATASGKAWLVDWIRDPHRRSPRTLMPTPKLEDGVGDWGLGIGKENGTNDASPIPNPQSPIAISSDPAADIAAYLLGSADWKTDEPAPLDESDLDELALMHLSKTFPRQEAEKYLAEGIPQSLADQVPIDAAELLGPITLQKKLRYVGRRTILKRGCFGCHDIPGFENAQLIGPALSDWGRKQQSLLAFEQVDQFLAAEDKGIGNRGLGIGREKENDHASPTSNPHSPTPSSTDPDRAFFEQAVDAHRREGFIWQKLRAPRSFDYKVAQNKGFNEWLTMGRFTLSDAEREAIMTFVLGLVAEPPAAKHVYHPDSAGRAIAEGRKVLDTHGCAECHTLALERWQFELDPDTFQPPPELPEFDFLKPHFTAAEIAASTATDTRGMAHAEVVGMPRLDASGEMIEDVDDDDNPLYFFTLWEPAVIGGQICAPGGADVMISKPQITAQRPPWGGALARLLFPAVLQQARSAGFTAAEMEAFGWLPPPLVGEGAKVQPDWLYQYLLNPTPIRPAAVMRMPKPNLSPIEAAALVDYFAATTAGQARRLHPAGRGEPTSPFRLPPSAFRPPPSAERLDQAMRLVTDRVTFCAKCHLIGDYSPEGAIRAALAPNLDQVTRRIRPEYLRRWIGDPKSAVPYTPMPVNFPPTGPPLGQDLLPGPSTDQIDSVEGLLLDYDQYIKSRTSIRAMIAPTGADGP